MVGILHRPHCLNFISLPRQGGGLPGPPPFLLKGTLTTPNPEDTSEKLTIAFAVLLAGLLFRLAEWISAHPGVTRLIVCLIVFGLLYACGWLIWSIGLSLWGLLT